MSFQPLNGIDLFGDIEKQQLAKIEQLSKTFQTNPFSTSNSPNAKVSTQTSPPAPIAQQSKSDASYFPFDLGQGENNKHYTRIDVFIVNTGKFYEDNKQATNESQPPKIASSSSTQEVMNKMAGLGTKIKSDITPIDKVGQYVAPAKYVNLDWTVGLPMPESVVTDHSAIWGKRDGGAFSGIISYIDSMSSSDKRKALDLGKAAGLATASGVAGLIEPFSDGANVVFELATKRSSNPRSEYLFDGVNNRNFNLQWKLIPRSFEESKKIREIVDRLKMLMYPELDKSLSNSFYIYPAIFEVTFMTGDQENDWLYKTSSCALTNVIINYTPMGQFVAFDIESNGSPSMGVELTLQFTELEFLHKARFEGGKII